MYVYTYKYIDICLMRVTAWCLMRVTYTRRRATLPFVCVWFGVCLFYLCDSYVVELLGPSTWCHFRQKTQIHVCIYYKYIYVCMYVYINPTWLYTCIYTKNANINTHMHISKLYRCNQLLSLSYTHTSHARTYTHARTNIATWTAWAQEHPRSQHMPKTNGATRPSWVLKAPSHVALETPPHIALEGARSKFWGSPWCTIRLFLSKRDRIQGCCTESLRQAWMWNVVGAFDGPCDMAFQQRSLCGSELLEAISTPWGCPQREMRNATSLVKKEACEALDPCVCIYVCIYIYIYICIYVYTYMYTYIHVYIHTWRRP